MEDGVRLLHVDDEPGFADLAATFLERENDAFAVETATNVQAALELFSDGFDGIISDYEMPGMNGLEFLEQIRETHPDLPFILFTGQGSEEIASDAISAGVTDYLQKESGTDQYTVLANRMRNAVEQYRSKHALEASEKRLSLFIEQSPLGVIEWDDTFDVAHINDAGEDILGYSEDELRGHPWEVIIPEAHHDAVSAVVSELLDVDGGYHSINKNVRSDGTRIICEWHNRIVTDDTDDVVSIFSQFQDITERRENRQRLEALIDNLPGMVYRHRNDDEWPLELIKGSCEELTGYSESEFLKGVSLAERIIHPDDKAYVEEQTARGLADSDEFELIYRIVRKDGETRWVWERGQRIDSSNDTEGLLEGLLIDVTELKQHEVDLNRTNTILSTVLENLPVGVLVEDEDRQIVSVNEKLLEIFDVDGVLSPAELIGRDCEKAAQELKGIFAEPDVFIESTNEKQGAVEPTMDEELTLADGRLLKRDHIPYELSDGTANLWVYYDAADCPE